LGIVKVYGGVKSNLWARAVGIALRAVDPLFESTAKLGTGKVWQEKL